MFRKARYYYCKYEQLCLVPPMSEIPLLARFRVAESESAGSVARLVEVGWRPARWAKSISLNAAARTSALPGRSD